MQILRYNLLFKEHFCKVEVYISVLGWKFRYSKLRWEKEYVHIEYSGPLTRLSSVLCKTLYTYIYLGDTKLHICKKKLAAIKCKHVLYILFIYSFNKKNFLESAILKFRFSKKAKKVCQDLPILLWCKNLIYRRPKKGKNWLARSQSWAKVAGAVNLQSNQLLSPTLVHTPQVVCFCGGLLLWRYCTNCFQHNLYLIFFANELYIFAI